MAGERGVGKKKNNRVHVRVSFFTLPGLFICQQGNTLSKEFQHSLLSFRGFNHHTESHIGRVVVSDNTLKVNITVFAQTTRNKDLELPQE